MLEIDPKHLRVTFCLVSFDSCGGSSKCYVSQYRIRILCHKASCITYIVNFSKATFCNVHFHKVNVHFCGFFSTCYLSHLKLNRVIVPKPIVSYCSALEYFFVVLLDIVSSKKRNFQKHLGKLVKKLTFTFLKNICLLSKIIFSEKSLSVPVSVPSRPPKIVVETDSFVK